MPCCCCCCRCCCWIFLHTRSLSLSVAWVDTISLAHLFHSTSLCVYCYFICFNRMLLLILYMNISVYIFFRVFLHLRADYIKHTYGRQLSIHAHEMKKSTFLPNIRQRSIALFGSFRFGCGCVCICCVRLYLGVHLCVCVNVVVHFV